MSIPVNTSTCKLNGFWQSEVLAKKVAPKYQCCSLFSSDPAETPEFCPPSAGWCKYQANVGKDWNVVKTLCCKSFSSSLGSSCGGAVKANTGIPDKSISTAKG